MFGFGKKKSADNLVQELAQKRFVEANERAISAGDFINADRLRQIAATTKDQALISRINRILANGRSLTKKEASQDTDTLFAGDANGNIEAAVKSVIERNEKAIVSGGYVDTYALSLAKIKTNNPDLRVRIDKLLKAKGMVAHINGNVVVRAMEGELPS